MKTPRSTRGVAKLAGMGVALALAGTACASSSTQVANPSAPTPVPGGPAKAAPREVPTDPLANPASSRRVVYASGLVSDPLPAEARSSVALSEAAARKKGKDNPFGAGLQPGTPEATLRSVSVGIPSNGRAPAGRPSWVLTWNDSKPDVKGPAGTDRPNLAEKVTCVFVVVVDARSGELRDARQLCVPKDPTR